MTNNEALRQFMTIGEVISFDRKRVIVDNGINKLTFDRTESGWNCWGGEASPGVGTSPLEAYAAAMRLSIANLSALLKNAEAELRRVTP